MGPRPGCARSEPEAPELEAPSFAPTVAIEILADRLRTARLSPRDAAAYVDPAARDLEAMHTAQLASWQARTAAEASVERAVAEPDRSRGAADDALAGLLAASRRMALHVLSLDARIAHAPEEPMPELAAFRDALLATLERNAFGVRHAAQPAIAIASGPALRDVFAAALPRDAAGTEAFAFVRNAGDELVDSANTMAELVTKLKKAYAV